LTDEEQNHVVDAIGRWLAQQDASHRLDPAAGAVLLGVIATKAAKRRRR
jgi:hypothetical protein